MIEGDEYLASPIDRRPKFHLYRPQIAILSGIAWDHINVFPTFDIYKQQFETFIQLIEKNGTLIYCREDEELNQLCNKNYAQLQKKIAYGLLDHKITNGITEIIVNDKIYPLQVFGNHNLLNLNAALLACKEIGITEDKFLSAITTFKGAAKRLELVFKTENFVMYKDFAHSPSKLNATTHAVKQQFKGRKIIACMELHTFSSLTEAFLLQYKGCMDEPDESIVYFNAHTLEHKKLKAITAEQVKVAFQREDLRVYTNSLDMVNYLKSCDLRNCVLLMMSSGNFDGIDFNSLAKKLKI